MFVKDHAIMRFRERLFNTFPYQQGVELLSLSDVYCMTNCFVDRAINEQKHFLCKYKGNNKSKVNNYNSSSYGVFLDNMNMVFILTKEMNTLITIIPNACNYYKTKDKKKEEEVKKLWEEQKQNEHNKKTLARININNNYEQLWQLLCKIWDKEKPNIPYQEKGNDAK